MQMFKKILRNCSAKNVMHGAPLGFN